MRLGPHQLTLFDAPAEAAPARRGPWHKIAPDRWHLVGTGFDVHHCGHPTAIWPYYISRPDGSMMLAPNGYGFMNLVEAMQAAELAALEAR